jgi:glycosyltransferase involved in cell wall biosynthesis
MISPLPIFFTLVISIRNQANEIPSLLAEVSQMLDELVLDYEIVIVDNASNDESLLRYKVLTGQDGLPNLQVYALTKEVDVDTAVWVGLENALGDFAAVIDPLNDDISFLPEMLDKAVSGADVVFAINKQKLPQSIAYRVASAMFNLLYKYFNGIHPVNEAPQYRVLSKRIINFILQHPQPAMTYRYLPATGGFTKINLKYSVNPKNYHKKLLWGSIDRGMKMLVSTTRTPMRLVTTLSLFGAVINLVYSVYVVAVAFIKTDIAPGWVSMSLQQSGMFCLISLVLLVLGEYILNMVSLQNEGPLYYVGQEFTSARMTRREKLNIEEVRVNPKNARDTCSERIF